MPRKEFYLQEEILGLHFSRRTFRVMQWNKAIEKSRTKEIINIDRCISQLNKERNRIAAMRNKLINIQDDFCSTAKLIERIHDSNDKSSLNKNTEKAKQTSDDNLKLDQCSLLTQQRYGREPSAIGSTENRTENWLEKSCKSRGVLNRRASYCNNVSSQTNGISSSMICKSNTVRSNLSASHLLQNRRHSDTYQLDRNAKSPNKAWKEDFPNVVRLPYSRFSSTAKQFVEKEPKRLGDEEPLSKTINTTLRSGKEEQKNEDDTEESAERFDVSTALPTLMTSTSPEKDSDNNEFALPKILERRRLSLLHITEIQNIVRLQKASSVDI